MKKLFIALLCLATFQISAQVTGKVLDESGLPLIGASVVEKGTFNGTITDIDGTFSLNTIGENPNLIVSYTGFGTQEIASDGSMLVTMRCTKPISTLIQEVRFQSTT